MQVGRLADALEQPIAGPADSARQAGDIGRALSYVEKLYSHRGAVTGVPSGFIELDRMTTGFQPADLVIIAGRPSMGKTAFALNIAQYAARTRRWSRSVISS